MELICINVPKGQGRYKAPDLIVGHQYTSIDQKSDKEMWALFPSWAKEVIAIPEGIFHKLSGQGANWYHEKCFIEAIPKEEVHDIVANTTKMIEYVQRNRNQKRDEAVR